VSLGVLFALLSAAVWGGGDFTGGWAAKRIHQVQVLTVSALSGMVLLAVLAVGLGEPLPSAGGVAWPALAGASGALGIASLYRGLAVGNAATVAPTAAVISASLPVVFAAATMGWPRTPQLSGFMVAMAGIWLTALSAPGVGGRGGLGHAVLAGLGFGGFYVLIAQAQGPIFGSLAIARAVAATAGGLLMVWLTLPLPSLRASPAAFVAGLLDAGGNVFYMLAQQHTRLDVAAVLASFYPVTTVLLARVVLKEAVTTRQWAGAALCLAAVALIAA
jgi:drug/metabolite transporter (DMT)-like permease